jgi:hypothetical protein
MERQIQNVQWIDSAFMDWKRLEGQNGFAIARFSGKLPMLAKCSLPGAIGEEL